MQNPDNRNETTPDEVRVLRRSDAVGGAPVSMIVCGSIGSWVPERESWQDFLERTLLASPDTQLPTE